jgi:rhodanese-related sulfurtransferase
VNILKGVEGVVDDKLVAELDGSVVRATVYYDNLITDPDVMKAALAAGDGEKTYLVQNITYAAEVIADAGTDQLAPPNSNVTLDGSGSSTGNNIEYLWQQVPTTTVDIINPATLSPVIRTPESLGAIITFQLTVTDRDTNLSATDTITITTTYIHTDISVDQAKAKNSDPNLLVIDVREKNEFCDQEFGHIPGALNYPWNSGMLQSQLNELPQNKDILIICRGGYRSDLAASFLAGQGFSTVYDINGGMAEWSGRGYNSVTCLEELSIDDLTTLLRLMTGNNSGPFTNIEDINDNNRFDLSEVIYILQLLSNRTH